MGKHTLSLTRLNALLISFSLIVISLFVGMVIGYVVGYQTAKSRGEIELANLRTENINLLIEANAKARERERELTTKANELSVELQNTIEQHANEVRNLQKRISYATTNFRTTPDAPLQVLPPTVFTNGFVSLYNNAIGAVYMPEPNDTALIAQTSDDALTLDSGLLQEDILAHISVYGERCRNIEFQLQALINWIEYQGGTNGLQ